MRGEFSQVAAYGLIGQLIRGVERGLTKIIRNVRSARIWCQKYGKLRPPEVLVETSVSL